MIRAVATFGGVLVIGLLAAGLTEATLAHGGHGKLTNDALLRPLGPITSPSPAAGPAHAVAPPPVPTTVPVVTPAPVSSIGGPTAITNSFVHLRTSNSASSAILVDLSAGTPVQVLPIFDTQWQQVSYNGQTGYIFRTYLTY